MRKTIEAVVASLGGGHRRGFVFEHNIFERIISLDNLFLAWREFKRGKSGKAEVQQFELNLEDNIFQLYAKLADRKYRHSPYSSFFVTDPKLRHIHKACLCDRVLHHAVFSVLYPIFESTFISDSYSCRLGKGTHRGVRQLELYLDNFSRHDRRSIRVLKCDVRKFFDTINQSVLIELIRNRIGDDDALRLIEHIIRSYRTGSGRGLPIGNVTSQLFANIYLNELDWFIKQELGIRYYLRYCDDFVILSPDCFYLEKTLQKITDFLASRLQLELHPDKIIARKYKQGIDFLGYIIRPNCVTLRTKTKKRLLKRVELKNSASYLGLLKHCDGYKIAITVKNRFQSGNQYQNLL